MMRTLAPSITWIVSSLVTKILRNDDTDAQ
jgi:hypothetical protein